jgi:hypothetical protein
MLPAGTYRMEIAKNSQTPKVMFYKENPTDQDWGGKVLASTTVKVVTEPQKNSQTEIDSVKRGNAQLLQVVRPRGWNEKLIFGAQGNNATHS